MDAEYEGKAKQIIPTDDHSIVIQRFKDSATAFNGEKLEFFDGKGKLNNAISTWVFERLTKEGVKNHFISKDNEIDMRIKRLKIFPLEIVVRNVVAGSLHKRIGLDEGTPLEYPIVETYYKRDDLGDPLLAETHVEVLKVATRDQLDYIFDQARQVNTILKSAFADAGMTLVDFKLEFGTDTEGNILLGDEVSPDTCRLWDTETGRKLDKDVFRRDLADLVETYTEVANRLGVNV